MIFNREKECMPREQIEALQSEKLQPGVEMLPTEDSEIWEQPHQPPES